MVSESVLEAYAGALESGWIEHGGRSPIAGYPSYELPEEQIVRDGFTALDERALGDIAVCPSAVRALRDVLRTVPATVEEFVDPGDWFYDELDKVDPPHPEFLPATVLPVERAVTGETKGGASRWIRYAPWAVAAAALVCAGIVWWTSGPKGPPGTQSPEVLMARASQTKGAPRGPNALAFDLELRADREGFATILVIPLDHAPRVYPEYDVDEERVGPNRPASAGPFETPIGSTVITIVTETPATDLVRRVVSQKSDPLTPENAVARVRDRLFASGYRWVAFDTTVVAPVKSRH